MTDHADRTGVLSEYILSVQARVTMLEAALREILEMQGARDYAYEEVNTMADIARAALDATKEEA